MFMTHKPAHDPLPLFDRAIRGSAHGLIRGYQLSLSALVGRHCRHWPSCSDYTNEAIQRHGLWAGGWIGLARICRCGPMGTSGIDLVCEDLPVHAHALTPWRYGLWRGVNAPPEADTGLAMAQKPFQLKE